MAAIESLQDYVTLGRSGLRVSRLCLGTMTFGEDWGWGSSEDTAKQILTRFLDSGCNFIDTADLYTQGTSEEYLGKFIQEMNNRDRLVLATKFTFNTHPGDPNAGGNGRKHMIEACEASLRRLKTDYIDLYWMHTWDTVTPAEEVMSALDALVRAGKVRYIGFSDVPGWYLGRAQTLAELRGWERVIALQLEYSLIERNIEFEYIDAAREMGLGICPWSPLGGGLLSGKYRRPAEGELAEGRLKTLADSPNPALNKFSNRNFTIVDALLEVAKEVGKTPAQVALNWATTQPGITSTIIGATKLPQLEDNLNALAWVLPDASRNRLEEASRPTPHFPYNFFRGHVHGMVTGGTRVRRLA